MAGVRDPAFWRRFSMAVHQNEDDPGRATTPAYSMSSRTDLKHSESWLERQHQKRKRVRYCAAMITLLVAATIAGVTVTLWYLSKHNWGASKDQKSS